MLPARSRLSEVELLVDERDALAERVLDPAEPHRPARHEDRAGIRGLHTGKDLEQRRLAGPVLTDQSEHLPVAYGQRHVDEGPNPRKPL